jgi:sulfoxide reductase catalytic subunit YedY
VTRFKFKTNIAHSEITSEAIYEKRREFMITGGLLGTALLLNPWTTANASLAINDYKPKVVNLDEALTSEKDATTYNNFYEFGTGKTDPLQNSQNFNTDDWKITVSGECEKPGEYALEDLVKPFDIEERIYRLRCVEAWSMVIPWLGVPMASILKSLQPTSKAKYVAFKTLLDPEQMPGQKRSVLQWPYEEGLRIDEAMNPLTLFAVGMYGKTMPNQNGAPVRLVVPWKYGFYSNVNPEVNHPRWSQKRERRIGEIFKQKTLMFNGYEAEVAHLYKGMDLRKHF